MFYVFIVLIISPLIFYLSKEDIVLTEMYCYHKYNNVITDGVAVKSKSKVKELMRYFPDDPLEGAFSIPPNNSFVMDTVRISAGEKVKVYQYLNDSSVAYISFKNSWYRPNSKVSKAESYGYIPIFMLHEKATTE